MAGRPDEVSFEFLRREGERVARANPEVYSTQEVSEFEAKREQERDRSIVADPEGAVDHGNIKAA